MFPKSFGHLWAMFWHHPWCLRTGVNIIIVDEFSKNSKSREIGRRLSHPLQNCDKNKSKTITRSNTLKNQLFLKGFRNRQKSHFRFKLSLHIGRLKQIQLVMQTPYPFRRIPTGGTGAPRVPPGLPFPGLSWSA